MFDSQISMFASCFGKKKRNDNYSLNDDPPSYNDVTEVSAKLQKRIKANEKEARRLEAGKKALADQRAEIECEKEGRRLKVERRALAEERAQLNDEQVYLRAQDQESRSQYQQQRQSEYYPYQQSNQPSRISPFAAGGMGLIGGLIGGMLLEDAIDNRGGFDNGGGFGDSNGLFGLF